MSHISRLGYTEGLNQGLEAAETSDSGDSLFLTQNPVPKPVRSQRPSRRGQRSDLAPLEDSEAESSSSSSQEESRTRHRARRRKRKLPRYTFGFLSGNAREDGSAGPEAALSVQKNRILHTFAVTGFFKCLCEFDAKTSSPTVHTDEEDLSPLPEEEEEESRTQPFRVVDKRRFVTALKTTSSQTWGGRRKRQGGKDPGYVGGSTSRDVAPWSSDSAAPSVDKKRDKPAEVDDHSDPGVCGDGGWEEDPQTGTGDPTPLSHGCNQSECSDARVKRKPERSQTHASVEGRRQEEPEDLSVPESTAPEDEPAASQATDEVEPNERHERQEERPEERSSRKRKKNKTKAAAAVREEHLESDVVTTDCMIPSEGGGDNRKTDGGDDVTLPSTANETLHVADGAPRSKRRKTKKHAGELQSPPRDAAAAGEAEDAQDPNTAAALEGRTGKSHKKKRVFREEGKSVTASTEGTPEAQRAEPKRKKHKMTTDAAEDGVGQSDCSEAAGKKGKRRTFVCDDAMEKDVPAPGDGAPIPAEVLDTRSAETAGSPEQPGCRVKKKNRKRNRHREDADRREGRGKEGEGGGDGLVTAEGAGVQEETPGKRTGKGKSSGAELDPPADEPPRGELASDSALSEFRGKKKKRGDAPLTSHIPASASPTSSSERSARKKPHKSKRRLYNPLGDFLE